MKIVDARGLHPREPFERALGFRIALAVAQEITDDALRAGVRS